MNITLRRRFYFTLLLFLLSLTLTSCTKSISDDDGIIEINSIDPSDKDFSDLMPLKKYIGDSVRVVMLGEASHGDGQAFLAKTRLIEFLHEEMGFDVFVIEGGMYDIWKSNNFIKEGKSAKTEFQLSVYEMWSYTQEFQPLIQYIEDSYNTSNPIEVMGIDLRERSKYAEFYLNEDMDKLFELINTGEFSNEDIKLFKEIMTWTAYGHLADISGENKIKFNQISLLINKTLTELIKYSGDIQRKNFYLFWRQFINMTHKRIEYLAVKDGSKISEESFNIGDLVMGDNIIWLCNEYFPNKKIIIWAHNIHVAKNYNHAEHLEGLISFETMGQNVYEKLKDKFYNIGFVSYGGNTWSLYDPELKFEIPQPRQNSLEDLLSKNNYDYLFMNFKSVKDNSLKEKRIASVANYEELNANWNELYDGIFYIKEMKPSTY